MTFGAGATLAFTSSHQLACTGNASERRTLGSRRMYRRRGHFQPPRKDTSQGPLSHRDPSWRLRFRQCARREFAEAVVATTMPAARFSVRGRRLLALGRTPSVFFSRLIPGCPCALATHELMSLRRTGCRWTGTSRHYLDTASGKFMANGFAKMENEGLGLGVRRHGD
jgi:hypothetical protein